MWLFELGRAGGRVGRRKRKATESKEENAEGSEARRIARFKPSREQWGIYIGKVTSSSEGTFYVYCGEHNYQGEVKSIENLGGYLAGLCDMFHALGRYDHLSDFKFLSLFNGIPKRYRKCFERKPQPLSLTELAELDVQMEARYCWPELEPIKDKQAEEILKRYM